MFTESQNKNKQRYTDKSQPTKTNDNQRLGRCVRSVFSRRGWFRDRCTRVRSRPSVPNPEIVWQHDRYTREIWNDSNSMRSPDCRTQ